MPDGPPLPRPAGAFAEYAVGVFLGALIPVLALVFGVMAGAIPAGVVAAIAMYGGAASLSGRRGFRALGLASGFAGLVVGGQFLLIAMFPDAEWGF